MTNYYKFPPFKYRLLKHRENMSSHNNHPIIPSYNTTMDLQKPGHASSGTLMFSQINLGLHEITTVIRVT